MAKGNNKKVLNAINERLGDFRGVLVLMASHQYRNLECSTSLGVGFISDGLVTNVLPNDTFALPVLTTKFVQAFRTSNNHPFNSRAISMREEDRWPNIKVDDFLGLKNQKRGCQFVFGDRDVLGWFVEDWKANPNSNACQTLNFVITSLKLSSSFFSSEFDEWMDRYRQTTNELVGVNIEMEKLAPPALVECRNRLKHAHDELKALLGVSRPDRRGE